MEKLSLADFRRHNSLTQQALATLLGVSRNYVALIENGKKPFTAKMRDKLSIVNNLDAPFDNEQAKLLSCSRCEDKDKEIAWLKDQVAGLVSALAAKPTVCASAPPACGVAAGADYGSHPEKTKKKGA